MSDQGGTVRYHRADLTPNGQTWLVWFTEDSRYLCFTAAEGEAMGLTPPAPAPAPLVVTCNGHSVELSDEAARSYICGNINAAPDTVTYRLARLLRDARQDPQPASDDDDDNTITFPRHKSVIYNCRIHSGVEFEFPAEGQAHIRPAPLSPGEHLRGLLAGRDDADELIEYAKQWGGRGLTPDGRWRAAIGDAAREVHG